MRGSDFIITLAGKIRKLIRARRIRKSGALARTVQRQFYGRHRLPALFNYTNVDRAGIGAALLRRPCDFGVVIGLRLFSIGLRLFSRVSATPVFVRRLAPTALPVGVIGADGDERKQQQQE